MMHRKASDWSCHLERAGLALLFLLSLPASIFGHVALFPQTARAGARHESFFIRAPVEKEIPVVELGFEVDRRWMENGGEITFQDVPDWDLHIEMDQDDQLQKVYWTTDGEGAPPHTFQMIFLRVNVPSEPGVYPFVSWQKYTDGSVVWWNEPREEDATNPYPTVRVEQEPLFAGGPLQIVLAAMALLALLLAVYSVVAVRRLAAGKRDSPDH